MTVRKVKEVMMMMFMKMGLMLKLMYFEFIANSSSSQYPQFLVKISMFLWTSGCILIDKN